MVTRPTRIHTQARWHYYLRRHFKTSGLSREELAGRLEMAPESVSRMLTKADVKGKITSQRLYQFADIMGVSVEELRSPPHPKDKPKPRSADEMMKDMPEDVKDKIFQIIEVWSGRKSA